MVCAIFVQTSIFDCRRANKSLFGSVCVCGRGEGGGKWSGVGRNKVIHTCSYCDFPRSSIVAEWGVKGGQSGRKRGREGEVKRMVKGAKRPKTQNIYALLLQFFSSLIFFLGEMQNLILQF